ncbi:DedA family protein [Ornithinibacillus sp. L9]|uniref:DedA family protein n=1 Tax=Ornithinibacillus caprae TaxID=2678566 RepID=A0A6N8FHE2_9BACI|nr:DedA family protein [Ornithinibacillus caprae]MUK87477.1 DedA family protein [Ornithinibacillus caprae]
METWYDLIAQYGYIAIFVLLTLGIVGLPVPDEVLLTYLGYVISLGNMNFLFTYTSALLGAICGITISYFLGIKLGEPFIRKFGKRLFISERMIQRTNHLFNRFGSFVLVICYFIPGVRHVAAYLGGISKFPFKRFAMFAYIGAIIWVSTFIVLGNQLGNNWDQLFVMLHHYIWIILPTLMIIILLLGIIVFYYRRKEKLISSNNIKDWKH